MKYLAMWEVAVLGLLRETAMHPYRMQRLLRERHQDEVLGLKPGSLYHAIGRLLQGGLIEIRATSREGRRPERTTYRITAAGRDELRASVAGMVEAPRREASDFVVAMSFLVHLEPAEALARLAERQVRLDAEIEQIYAELRAASAEVLPPIHRIDRGYLLTMRKAEAEWVRGLTTQVKAGFLAWKPEEIFREAAGGGSEGGGVGDKPGK